MNRKHGNDKKYFYKEKIPTSLTQYDQHSQTFANKIFRILIVKHQRSSEKTQDVNGFNALRQNTQNTRTNKPLQHSHMAISANIMVTLSDIAITEILTSVTERQVSSPLSDYSHYH